MLLLIVVSLLLFFVDSEVETVPHDYFYMYLAKNASTRSNGSVPHRSMYGIWVSTDKRHRYQSHRQTLSLSFSQTNLTGISLADKLYRYQSRRQTLSLSILQTNFIAIMFVHKRYRTQVLSLSRLYISAIVHKPYCYLACGQSISLSVLHTN